MPRHNNRKSQALVVYFAGPLFTAQEIAGNQLLASAIQRQSQGRYQIFLPQTHPAQESHEASNIRQVDLTAVVTADLFLGNFNGPDLDSGTVAEFVTAKFADRPAVLLRTDFRTFSCLSLAATATMPASCAAIPFNSVLLCWPRTELLFVDALGFYSTHNTNSQLLIEYVASLVVPALDRVVALPPLFSGAQQRCSRELVSAVLSSRCTVSPAPPAPVIVNAVDILGQGPITNCPSLSKGKQPNLNLRQSKDQKTHNPGISSASVKKMTKKRRR